MSSRVALLTSVVNPRTITSSLATLSPSFHSRHCLNHCKVCGLSARSACLSCSAVFAWAVKPQAKAADYRPVPARNLAPASCVLARRNWMIMLVYR
jgi:threonine/homoserine/homoserine lactone efflux protein